jgi:hypothetical protein
MEAEKIKIKNIQHLVIAVSIQVDFSKFIYVKIISLEKNCTN